jgi:hypothetical protein
VIDVTRPRLDAKPFYRRLALEAAHAALVSAFKIPDHAACGVDLGSR